MNVIISPSANKQLTKFPRRESAKIIRKIKELEINPFSGKSLMGKLKGLYTIRAWPYRIIYKMTKDRHMVYIETIEHRQGVYK